MCRGFGHVEPSFKIDLHDRQYGRSAVYRAPLFLSGGFVNLKGNIRAAHEILPLRPIIYGVSVSAGTSVSCSPIFDFCQSSSLLSTVSVLRSAMWIPLSRFDKSRSTFPLGSLVFLAMEYTGNCVLTSRSSVHPSPFFEINGYLRRRTRDTKRRSILLKFEHSTRAAARGERRTSIYRRWTRNVHFPTEKLISRAKFTGTGERRKVACQEVTQRPVTMNRLESR